MKEHELSEASAGIVPRRARTLTRRRFGRPNGAHAPRISPSSVKPAPIALGDDASIDDAIVAVIGACLHHWQINSAAARDENNPEGIHQVRVGLRRLRSALTLFKTQIPAEQRSHINEEAKWLLKQLGPVRDLDVFIHTLAAPFAEHVSDDQGLAYLIRTAREARARAHGAAAIAMTGTRARRFAARLEAFLQGRGWRQTSGVRRLRASTLARNVLNQRLRRIRAAANNFSELTIAERHDLRIAVKKTRYGIEFFSGVLPAKRAARWTASLKHLQDSLGHLNDLDVAERTVAGLLENAAASGEKSKIAAAGRAVRRWHKKAAANSEPETRKQCRRLARIDLF